MEKCRDERTIEIARSMKQEGLDASFIAKMTGLPLEEIEQIA
ncbi:MAG: hypothetical protein ACRC46_10060 [Thermoguttaceae bacterium]